MTSKATNRSIDAGVGHAAAPQRRRLTRRNVLGFARAVVAIACSDVFFAGIRGGPRRADDPATKTYRSGFFVEHAMAEEVEYSPNIVAAEAFSPTHFAVAFGALEYDDPFTIVLEYDQSFPQPWSRTDIAREIKAIVPWRPSDAARFVVMSDEGDVYFIGDQTMRERIVGAGIASPDSTGKGTLFGLSNFGRMLVASGFGEQLYERTGANHWDRIAIATTPEAGNRSASGKLPARQRATSIFWAWPRLRSRRLTRRPRRPCANPTTGMHGRRRTRIPPRGPALPDSSMKAASIIGTAQVGESSIFRP